MSIIIKLICSVPDFIRDLDSKYGELLSTLNIEFFEKYKFNALKSKNEE